MDPLAPPLPGGPVPWDALRAAFPWVEALHATPQDPVWHAEGDVGVHTRAVLEVLVDLPGYAALDPVDRRVVWLAALLHDVGKPATTRTEDDGRITSRGHSARGAILARQLLWHLGEDPPLRERVCALVRSHQVPFFLTDRDDAFGLLARLTQEVRADLLFLVALADARGREARDRRRIEDACALFRLFAEEHGCWDRPWPFPSAHARFLCGRDPARSPHAPAPPDPAFTVTLTSGLPGAGKGTWLRAHRPHLPVVSLDALRAELDVDPEDPQGPVVAAARERAREHLRARRPFALDATNLSRRIRDGWIGLCADYGAAIEVVAIEAPPEVLHAQNRGRAARVPTAVIEALAGRWEFPSPLDAHALLHVG